MSFDPSISAIGSFSTAVYGSAYNLTNIERSGHVNTEIVSNSVNNVEAHIEYLPVQTDYAREFTDMTVYENGFAANTVSIRTHDDMTGTIINMKV